MLLETNLGYRYFTKFESMNKELTEICEEALSKSICFSENDDKKIAHFGIVLEENGPLCKSKFAEDYNGVQCVDGMCNHPDLTIYNKYICALMTCTHCKNSDCVAKQPCYKVIKSILQIQGMIRNATDTPLENVLEKFFMKRYGELVSRSRLQLPYFLE